VKKSDRTFILGLLFLLTTVLAYVVVMLFHRNLLYYYPVSHTWGWGAVSGKNVVAQGWYYHQLFAYIVAALVTLLVDVVLFGIDNPFSARGASGNGASGASASGNAASGNSASGNFVSGASALDAHVPDSMTSDSILTDSTLTQKGVASQKAIASQKATVSQSSDVKSQLVAFTLRPVHYKVLGILVTVVILLCMGCMMYREYHQWGII
jgi:hypothetical protein